MSVQVFCPKCDRSCRIREEFLGRRVRCPGCQEVFKAEEVPIAEFDEADSEPLPEYTPPPMPRVPDIDDRPRRPREEDDEPRKPRRKEPSGIAPGKVENPFDDKSRLADANASVDRSQFDFDFDAPTPPKKRQVESSRDDEDDDKDDSDLEDAVPRKKRAPETLQAWSRESPRDELPEEPAPKKAVKRPETASETPFSFGEQPGTGPAPKKATPDDHDRPAPRKEPAKRQPINDDADFLGLQNFDEPADEKPVARKKSSEKRFFHARQSALLGEARLFRVFVEADEIVFVTAAAGKEVAAVEEALANDSLDKLDRKSADRLSDLDELSIDELCEADRHSFRLAAGKIISAAIDPAGRKLLRKSGAGTMLVEHKSKGELSFDLPDEDDVRQAIDLLPDLIDDVFDVNVRWDKHKEAYIAR